MTEISPQQLHDQLREMVELLAAPADTQIRWLDAERFPVDELMQQFDDAVPAWFARLRDHGLLPVAESTALQQLHDLLMGMTHSQTRVDLWEDDALRTAPEWQAVRLAAAQALTLME